MNGNFKRGLLALALMLAISASATDGYFSTGYGVIQQGHGGAGIALPQDSLAAATNPAGMVFVGDRFDFGVTFFRPIRSGSITGSGAPGVDGDYDASRRKNFFIPELGFTHQLSPKLSLGVSMFGNGGMNTAYTTAIPLLGSKRAGVDLTQLFVAPTVAFKANAHNAFGVSLNLGYQRFSASGLQNFDNPIFSSAAGNVTDVGYTGSFGAGFRVGWLGTINKALSWDSRIRAGPTCRSSTNTKGCLPSRAGLIFPRMSAAAWRSKFCPRRRFCSMPSAFSTDK